VTVREGEPVAVEWAALSQRFGQTSMLDGWLPLTMELVAGLMLVAAIGFRSRG
jgi:hypothetical protein